MATSILITGASGLVGTRLTEMLLQKGYHVAHLGRSRKSGTVPSFVWNVDKGELDPEALKGVDAIVHLAGAGVADKRWTAERKQLIRESRTKSSALIYETLKSTAHSVKALVSASAIGYYGCGLDDQVFNEESTPGSDYLANVVVDWEKEVDRIGLLGVRVAKIRIGIVLSEKGGALKEMAAPVRLGIGSPLGTGRQILSWIHLDDLCSIFIHALENQSMSGPYNAAGVQPMSNRELTKAIAKALHKPFFLPAVPSFILRMVVGEMAYIVLNGRNVSSEKILKVGFKFRFSDLNQALTDLLKQ